MLKASKVHGYLVQNLTPLDLETFVCSLPRATTASNTLHIPLNLLQTGIYYHLTMKLVISFIRPFHLMCQPHDLNSFFCQVEVLTNVNIIADENVEEKQKNKTPFVFPGLHLGDEDDPFSSELCAKP